jgi:SAM-dependent methyltransferase
LAPGAEELRQIYRRQAAWFAGERNRLLRRADIARCDRVLDLGCGSCETLRDLERRVGGAAVGVDLDLEILRLGGGRRVAADGRVLPFAAGCFDLVFAQMFFMWARPEEVLPEISRVMAPGGSLVACAEPDYGGVVEHPPAGRMDTVASSLRAEGADVEVGRKLGAALQRAGFRVECGVHPARPLEAGRGDSGFAAPGPGGERTEFEFLFVPHFWFLAVKPT